MRQQKNYSQMLIGVTGVNATSPQTSTPQAGGIGM